MSFSRSGLDRKYKRGGPVQWRSRSMCGKRSRADINDWLKGVTERLGVAKDHSVKEVAESAGVWKCTVIRLYQQWLKSQSTGNSSLNCARDGVHQIWTNCVSHLCKSGWTLMWPTSRNLSNPCPIQSQLLFGLMEVLHPVRYVSVPGDSFVVQ